MAKRVKAKTVYGAVPTRRVVYGLKAIQNPETGFVQDRVETRDFKARPYVYCNVGAAENRRLMIFGWLDDKESALQEGKVAVMTLSPAERKALHDHLTSSSIGPPPQLSFW
ncbi:MAG: hypothetical protein WC866_00925 [Patescibacteria group bacterium]|jgi:hypothetical protein